MNERNVKNLSKSFIVVGFTAAVSQLLSIGYLVFLARWIGPDTYAVHVGLFNICAISAFLVNWGLDTWLLKQTSDNQATSMSVLMRVLLIKLGFGVLWALALIIVVPLLKPEIFRRELLSLAMFSTLFESLTNSIYMVFLTTNRFRQSSAILLFGRLFRLVSLVSLYFLSINKLGTIIAVRTLIDLLVLVVAGLIFGIRFTGWNFARKELRTSFADAVPFHASELLYILFRNIDVTLVTFLSKSLATISSYSLMISFFNVISTVILSLMNVVVPSLSSNKDRSSATLRGAAARTITGFFVLGLALWAIIGLFGQQVFRLILGSQYIMMADFISKAAVIVLVSSLNVGLTAILITHNRQKERVFPQILSLSFKVVASILLFPMWQVDGLRWVYILSEIMLSLGYLLVVSGVFKELSNSKAKGIKYGDKLKIALLTFNQEGKGTYLRAFFLGNELVKLGHDVTILAGCNTEKRTHEHTENGLKIVTFPRLINRFFLSGWNLDELIHRLLWVKRHDFNLVHAFECRPTTYFPARQLQNRGAAFFTDWADWLGKGGSVEERPDGIGKQVLRIFETHFENKRFQNSDGITAICSTLFEESINRGYPSNKVLLLPNGMGNPYLQSFSMQDARTKTGLPQEGLIIGYLGSGFRIDMELMYSAFNVLKKKTGDGILLHIGRSNYHTEINNSIICTGPVSYEDVSYYLSACNFFWFPLKMNKANFGRLPLKFSDYLTIGRPIISTDAGDLAEWIRSLHVGLIAEDNPESISDKVLEIVQFPETENEMGENARLTSKRYDLSWKKRAQELENFYFQRMDQKQETGDYGKNEVQMLQ